MIGVGGIGGTGGGGGGGVYLLKWSKQQSSPKSPSNPNSPGHHLQQSSEFWWLVITMGAGCGCIVGLSTIITLVLGRGIGGGVTGLSIYTGF